MGKNKMTVAVIGEGITEKYFIQSLRDVLQIKPTPFKPKNSSLKELEIAIKECIKRGYGRIYCMIDVDNKIHDGNPDHDKNFKEYTKLKKQYHKKQCKCADGSFTHVVMVESFPATEIFFWYYFGYTSASFSNQQLKSLLNKRIGYLTEEKFLIKHSIHDMLIQSGGSLRTAILASEQSVSDSVINMEPQAYSEIGIMLRELLPIGIEL